MVFKVKATGASANQVAQGGHNHGSTGTHNHAASGSTPTLMTVANSRIDMSAAPGSGYKYRDPNIPAPNTATQVNGKTVRKVTLEVEEVDRGGGARRDRSHVDVQRAEYGTDSARQGRRHF